MPPNAAAAAAAAAADAADAAATSIPSAASDAAAAAKALKMEQNRARARKCRAKKKAAAAAANEKDGKGGGETKAAAAKGGARSSRRVALPGHYLEVKDDKDKVLVKVTMDRGTQAHFLEDLIGETDDHNEYWKVRAFNQQPDLTQLIFDGVSSEVEGRITKQNFWAERWARDKKLGKQRTLTRKRALPAGQDGEFPSDEKKIKESKAARNKRRRLRYAEIRTWEQYDEMTMLRLRVELNIPPGLPVSWYHEFQALFCRAQRQGFIPGLPCDRPVPKRSARLEYFINMACFGRRFLGDSQWKDASSPGHFIGAIKRVIERGVPIATHVEAYFISPTSRREGWCVVLIGVWCELACFALLW